MVEWAFGGWQISVQRAYPTTQQLLQTHNQAACWWHQHLRLLGYGHAFSIGAVFLPSVGASIKKTIGIRERLHTTA